MMQGNQAHLSDAELLLFSDQELSTRHATLAREHVAQCESCRKRLIAIESASSDFAELHEQGIRAQNSSSPVSRDLLKTRLSEASAQGRRSRSVTSWGAMTQQLAGACLALLLVVGGTWAIRHIGRDRPTSNASIAEAIALPRRTLTPGSVRAVQIADLCRSQDLDNDPPVNPSLEQAVFKEYSVPASSTKNYALDYLITPALGGSDSIQNLWPQPYSSTWNSHVKDQLEDHLHELVCQGKVQLATAQSDIATDWIAAYKRYFNTDKPEPGPSAAANVGSSLELEPRRRNHRGARISTVYNLALLASSWQPPATAATLRQAEWRR
jgi:hypothetical protein